MSTDTSKKTNNLRKFNQTFQKFANELTDIYNTTLSAEFLTYYGTINEEDEFFLKEYLVAISPHVELLKDEQLDLLKQPILKYIIFNELSLSSSSLYSIFRYLKILYIYAFKHTYDGNVNDLLRKLMDTPTADEDLAVQERLFLDIVDSLKRKKQVLMNNIDEQLDSAEDNFEEEVKDSFENFKFPGSDKLLGGDIGRLAMDIAKDINVNDLDLGDPTKLMSSIMSGNLQENSGLMSLFGNITNKIKSKIDSGSLDTEKLHQEASGILNNKQSPFNNFSNIAKNMMAEGGSPVDAVNSVMNNVKNMRGGGVEEPNAAPTLPPRDVPDESQQQQQPPQLADIIHSSAHPSLEDKTVLLEKMKKLNELKKKLDAEKSV
jgi:hypothetical protein